MPEEFKYDFYFKSSLDLDGLTNLIQGRSIYGPEKEGIYIKAGDGLKNIFRCKLVKEGFKPREDFNDTEIIRNLIKKG